MPASTLSDASDTGAVCPFCGMGQAGSADRCTRCGFDLTEAGADAGSLGSEARRRLHRRRIGADALFLAGLLLGGPMMTMAGDVQTGLFIVLAGGLASLLRRHTDWSTVGAVVVGSVAAAIAATLVTEPVADLEAATLHTDARGAFAEALSAPEWDVFVEARGPGLLTIWFTVSSPGECGDYPPAEVREHLAALGFRRVVVMQRNQSGGLCSFAP